MLQYSLILNDYYTQRAARFFVKGSYRTINAQTATKRGYYRGEKFNKKGIKAVIGKLKQNGKWTVVRFIVPKYINL